MTYTIDDTDVNTGWVSDVCTFCKHLKDGYERECEAFDKRIPDDIWLGKNSHRKPYKGDNGIQFEPIEE